MQRDSEGLEQLELPELEPGVTGAEVEAEAQREPIPAATKKERKHPDVRSCPLLWSESNKSSHAHPSSPFAGFAVTRNRSSVRQASEVLDVAPAKYFVQVTKREKRACTDAKKAESVAHRFRSAS